MQIFGRGSADAAA